MTDIGVVLAGGTGSRLLPLTRTINKHLLPVNGKPMLHWPLRTLAQLGIDRAIVVLGGRSCGEVIEQFRSSYDTGEGVIALSYVYQEGAGGIPAALREALPTLEAMRADRAVVILGDNVFPTLPAGLLGESLVLAEDAALVIAKPVDDASSYGCVALGHEGRIDGEHSLVEKPRIPPPAGTTWAAILGVYDLPMDGLRSTLEALVPSARGELEIVDVLNAFRLQGRLGAHLTYDVWIDAGDPPGYALANDPSFWRDAPEAKWPAGGRS